ncbi:MAG TPA: nicotinate (nicotinamide) nucleotide adenylyltransferase [Bacteroidales bacterium]|jgi:nicotinate-nucleotide adenylyltransferase|nr:nicotinate (nicotinamide) nucleotide adenylyltransferase [Bacteroidales bacterium]
MKVGLFFGSFNPIHIGHLAIANYMVEFTNLDELWFVITPQNPAKQKSTLLADSQRYYMVELAIEPFTKMKASRIEFTLPQPSYTIHTLIHLHELYPQHSFALIMGSDNLQTFNSWKNYKEILDSYSIYVYNRPNTQIPDEFKHHPAIEYVEAPLMEISSSFIRQSIKQGKNIRGFMPESAWKYLDEMNFYK